MPPAALLLLTPAATVVVASSKAGDTGWQVFGAVLGGVTVAALLAVGKALSYAARARAEATAREVVEHEMVELRRRLDALEGRH